VTPGQLRRRPVQHVGQSKLRPSPPAPCVANGATIPFIRHRLGNPASRNPVKNAVKNHHRTGRIWQYQTDRRLQVNALRSTPWTPRTGLTRKGSEVQILYRPPQRRRSQPSPARVRVTGAAPSPRKVRGLAGSARWDTYDDASLRAAGRPTWLAIAGRTGVSDPSSSPSEATLIGSCR
jgi:hypothetical protein